MTCRRGKVKNENVIFQPTGDPPFPRFTDPSTIDPSRTWTSLTNYSTRSSATCHWTTRRINSRCKIAPWSRNRGRTPAEDAFSEWSIYPRRSFGRGWIASHLRTTSCCSTSARYPTSPPLQDVGYWGSIASMSSRTISRPSINFDTSPYPPCTFYQTFPNRSRYSQPFDTPSRDCPSNSATSRQTRSSLSSTISRGSTVSISFIFCTRWMTSPPLLFLVRQYGSFTSPSCIFIQMATISSISCQNLDCYLTRSSSTNSCRFLIHPLRRLVDQSGCTKSGGGC